MSRSITFGILGIVIAIAALAAACVPTVSSPLEYGPKPISASEGARYFNETGGGDPYATGMAYPVFLALMEAFPEELGRDWNAFSDKFGTIPNPTGHGDPNALPVGFHLTTDPNTQIPWLVANCTFCHSTALHLPGGDKVVLGMGSKKVRPHAYIDALVRIGTDARLDDDRILQLANKRASEAQVPWTDRMAGPIVHATLDAFRKGSRMKRSQMDRLAAAMPGRAATIEAFMIALDLAGAQIALPDVTGWAKIPDVRGFPVRDTFSYDGSGYGSPQALVLEADFVFGARPEWYASHAYIATSMYLYLRQYDRQLPFPGPIDGEMAAHGRTTFDAHCAGCHGTYVKDGSKTRVAYHEQVIPIEAVGTDPARINAVTPDFVHAANAYPLTQGLTAVRNTGGYVPPVLLDVWARAPLGHAGQWPSVAAMALEPESRPRRFVADPDAMYNLDTLGIAFTEMATGSPVPTLSKSQYLYDASAPGFGVQGHPFLSNLPPDDRRAVLEYLKTL